jgi:signal transduction histidine kinase
LILASVFQERIRAEKEAKKTNIELQRLSELKSEFAGVVAHELKTPLTVIKEGIGMVLDGVDGPVNESQRGTLGLARNNVDRLGRLINNVLTYERLESGKMELEFEKISLNELVQEVFQFMEWAGLQKNLKMHLQTPQETIWACCDSDKIKEVLINLIDNSFKNTPSGGEVRIEMRGGEKEILFQVEDTGIGIPKKDQEEIFKMFRQASAPGTVKIPGAGIGLTVCKLIVELHQGKISVESELGRGTKFTVRIPKGEAVPAV